MAHFRGTVTGNRETASRLGSKGSGLVVEAQSWQGKVRVHLFHDESTGKDMVRVWKDYHNGAGVSRLLYRGPVGDTEAITEGTG